MSTALLSSHPCRVPANSGLPQRIFCGAGCGRQMLPGQEWTVGGIRERLCPECAIWARRVRLGIVPNIPEGM